MALEGGWVGSGGGSLLTQSPVLGPDVIAHSNEFKIKIFEGDYCNVGTFLTSTISLNSSGILQEAP